MWFGASQLNGWRRVSGSGVCPGWPPNCKRIIFQSCFEKGCGQPLAELLSAYFPELATYLQIAVAIALLSMYYYYWHLFREKVLRPHETYPTETTA